MSKFAQFGNDLYTGKRSIDFIGRRRTWYLISAIGMVLALAGLGLRGLNLGIEFTGGSEFRVSQVAIASDYEQQAQEAVHSVRPGQGVGVTKLGSDTVRVQTDKLDDAQSNAVRDALARSFGTSSDKVSANFIGPSWGESVSKQALKALFVFLGLVMLVMALYFRTWKMALAALVALLHDMLFTVGIYALTGVEVSPATMIGFLTVLGYSLYDTVVVFDKVRENTTEAFANRRSTFAAAANLAVNQTLVRSINTTVVALLPIAAVLVVAFLKLGPGTLLDLALALFIGMAVGAYSSIFIATPFLVSMRSKDQAVLDLDKHAARVQARTTRGTDSRREAAPARKAVGAAGATAPATQTSAARTSAAKTTAASGATALGATALGATAPAAGANGIPADGTGITDSQDAPVDAPRGTLSGRQVHKYAQSGPRNQPRRQPKSKR